MHSFDRDHQQLSSHNPIQIHSDLHQSHTLNSIYTDPFAKTDKERLMLLEENEPKRRLIRDANALRQARGITQAQMAEELGVPRRTLEEWLQGRRYPKTPGQTLIKRWVDAFTEHN